MRTLSVRPVIEVVDREMAAVLRQKTELERLHIAWGMWHSAWTMLDQILRSERPELTEQQRHIEVARRMSHEPG